MRDLFFLSLLCSDAHRRDEMERAHRCDNVLSLGRPDRSWGCRSSRVQESEPKVRASSQDACQPRVTGEGSAC